MAYNSSMVGSNDRPTNSSGVTFYGPESVAQLGYFNTFVSIQLFPIKPPDQRGPKSMYDYNNRVSCVISREDTLYLAWVLKNIFPKKTANLEPCFTGIQTGQNTMLCISNGITETSKTVEPTIAIFKGFDEKKRAVEKRVFKFRPKVVITKYDPETGDSDAIEDTNYGIYTLAEFFAQAAAALAGGAAHFERHFERFRTNEDFHIIRSIAGKLGIPTQQSNVNHVGGNNSPSANFNTWKSSGNSGSNEDLASNTVTSSSSGMGDLAALMSSATVDELPGLN